VRSGNYIKGSFWEKRQESWRRKDRIITIDPGGIEYYTGPQCAFLCSSLKSSTDRPRGRFCNLIGKHGDCSLLCRLPERLRAPGRTDHRGPIVAVESLGLRHLVLFGVEDEM
jgi:hypothetical protein